LAIDNGCGSIAFPAVSCGVYGYPLDEAARISISVCKQGKYESLVIYFYLFSKELVDIWNAELGEKSD